MHLSTHYYVLSLSARRNALFEAFRDTLIEVENQGFPVVRPSRRSDPNDPAGARTLASAVDLRFGAYYLHEPLYVVIVGPAAALAAFRAVTAHGSAVIGQIPGDHVASHVRDLGEIVWPVVREAMSGVLRQTLEEIDALDDRGRVVSGLEAVVRAAPREIGCTLLVESDYRVRGSIVEDDGPPAVTPEVDVRTALDDVVDGVIDRVLGRGGDVVFAPPGSMTRWNRIALLLR